MPGDDLPPVIAPPGRLAALTLKLTCSVWQSTMWPYANSDADKHP